MRRYPTKPESQIVLVVMFVLFFIARCTADDKVTTPAGDLILTSPIGDDDIPELHTALGRNCRVRTSIRATITPLDEIDGESHKLEDGIACCVFWPGTTPRRFRFLWTPEEGPHAGEPQRFVVVAGGDAPPPGPDDPEPTLNARAAAVRDQARLVGQPAMAERIGDAYASVAAMIGAGTVSSLPAAKAAIEAEMKPLTLDRKWEKVGKAIAKAFNDQAQNLPDAKKLFQDVADGMHVAARWP